MGLTEISTASHVLRRTPWKAGPSALTAGGALVSLTDFQVEGFVPLARVAASGLRMQRGWPRQEGSLGLAFWVHPLRKRLGSLSAWESEDDLGRWLASPDHRAAVHEHRGHMHQVSSATWRADRFDVDEAWREVERRWKTAAS
jgi:heme-degrading monooxygenase HmoA